MLDCKVAILTKDMIAAKRRGYWTKATIEKWLADQGFIVRKEKIFPIAKSFNPLSGTFHFVQNQYRGVSR